MSEFSASQNVETPVTPPQNPCEICRFWSVNCNQAMCSEFQKYKEEIKKLRSGG